MTEWPSRVETMARCGGLAVDLRRRSNAASIFVAGETDARSSAMVAISYAVAAMSHAEIGCHHQPKK
jgi:hypothetical protein